VALPQELLGLLVYLAVVLGGLAALWFFTVRRDLIRRMKRVVEILEEELRPRDKSYTLLGYLVGFRAVYRSPRIRGVDTAWALYTQPPRHVLLYLPLLHLYGARERLELTLRLSRPPRGEAHLYAPWDRATRREVERDTAGAALRAEPLELAGEEMRLLTDGSPEARAAAVELATQLARVLGEPPLRVTLSQRHRALHVALEPRIATLRNAVRTVARYAEKLQEQR